MVPIQQTTDGEVWPSMKTEHKVFNGDYLFRQVTKIRKNIEINYKIANIFILWKILGTYVGRDNTSGI